MSLSARHALGEPTSEQWRRWDLLRHHGCIACSLYGNRFVPGEIHHLTLGGKHGAPRLGHSLTICLCRWHHRGICNSYMDAEQMEKEVGPSYARTPKAFRAEVGGDQYLLDASNELIGWPKVTIPSRREKAKETTRERGGRVSKKQSSGRRTTAAANQVPRPAGGFA